MYSALEKEITLTNKLIDINVSGHVIINEKIHATSMERYGPIANVKVLMILALHLKLWLNAHNFIKLATDYCNRLDERVQETLKNFKTANEFFNEFDELRSDLFKVYEPHYRSTLVISLSEMIALSIVCRGIDGNYQYRNNLIFLH